MSSRRQSGSSLIELVVALALLGMLLVIAAQLQAQLGRAARQESSEAGAQLARFTAQIGDDVRESVARLETFFGREKSTRCLILLRVLPPAERKRGEKVEDEEEEQTPRMAVVIYEFDGSSATRTSVEIDPAYADELMIGAGAAGERPVPHSRQRRFDTGWTLSVRPPNPDVPGLFVELSGFRFDERKRLVPWEGSYGARAGS